MSILKDAIKTLTTEGTKKRYWPSKNPIDDPTDFPGEQNFGEEEAEVTDDVQLNRFQVKALTNAIRERVHQISKTDGHTPEAEWLDWLEDTLLRKGEGYHGKASITRPEFLKVLQHWRLNTKTRHEADGWGDLNIKQVLDNAIGDAKELYADNIGAYGRPQGEENEEGWFDGVADDFDERFKMKQEKEHERVQKPGAPESGDNHFAGLADDFEDRFGKTEEEEDDGDYAYDRWKDEQMERDIADGYKSHKEAKAARKGGEWNAPREEEEQSDCQMCGNTGYSMEDGQTCSSCYRGKAERREQAREDRLGHNDPDRGNDENEEQGDDERENNSELMPAISKLKYDDAQARHTARMQQSGNKYWSVGSNHTREEDEEVKLPTTKYAKTFQQWLPTKK